MNSTKEDAKQALDAIEHYANNVVAAMEIIRKSVNLTEVLRFYKDIHEYAKLIENFKDIIDKARDETKKKIIPDLFESMEIDNITAHNKKFYLTTRQYFSIRADKKQEGKKWLIDNGYGALLKEEVNAQSLSSAMNAFVEDKGEYPPEDYFSIYTDKSISMRKA